MKSLTENKIQEWLVSSKLNDSIRKQPRTKKLNLPNKLHEQVDRIRRK